MTSSTNVSSSGYVVLITKLFRSCCRCWITPSLTTFFWELFLQHPFLLTTTPFEVWKIDLHVGGSLTDNHSSKHCHTLILYLALSLTCQSMRVCGPLSSYTLPSLGSPAFLSFFYSVHYFLRFSASISNPHP